MQEESISPSAASSSLPADGWPVETLGPGGGPDLSIVVREAGSARGTAGEAVDRKSRRQRSEGTLGCSDRSCHPLMHWESLRDGWSSSPLHSFSLSRSLSPLLCIRHFSLSADNLVKPLEAVSTAKARDGRAAPYSDNHLNLAKNFLQCFCERI